ncbi:transcription elongation factor GreB [Novacetimonas pomaceti]|uniref:Transcription elongation factor GreB n=1 Tax=Novacetimonas pomaceti TaxID=2021998 RepID=A0ABX5P506_9PROT|nr:transcription elongation factor GreB [Novacetimonas pomaceti]MBV1833177.1 transcription elongation factor GreB [Novacetimonas pomaceti]PYD48872.1 transcription elongation factor GreB [Novacetimonas pomaceti]
MLTQARPAADAGRGGDLARYISPVGMETLRRELNALLRDERPRIVEIVSWAAGNGDRSENGDYLYGKKRLREIDRRVRFLTKRIEKAIVVDPAAQPRRDRVFFGASVTYLTERDETRVVTIMGVDEADTARGEISLLSPVARALMRAQVGDEVRLRTPRGDEMLEIISISYPPAVDARP